MLKESVVSLVLMDQGPRQTVVTLEHLSLAQAPAL